MAASLLGGGVLLPKIYVPAQEFTRLRQLHTAYWRGVQYDAGGQVVVGEDRPAGGEGGAAMGGGTYEGGGPDRDSGEGEGEEETEGPGMVNHGEGEDDGMY